MSPLLILLVVKVMSYSSVYWKNYDRSSVFAQEDVFYNYLGKDPENADLAMLKNVALNSFDRHLNNVMQVSKNVEPYRRIAEYEKEKELALLREVFGQELTISLDKPQDAKMLIDALNSAWRCSVPHPRAPAAAEACRSRRYTSASRRPPAAGNAAGAHSRNESAFSSF